MSGPGTIEISRRLSAPIAEVFQWWTEADRLREWMSPTGTVDAEVDLRVGGSLHIVMKDGDTVIDHVGEYLEVELPNRLVFTWVSQFTGPEPSLVTVELTPDGADATHLRLVHSKLPESVASSHRGGWGAMLDRLSTNLSARAA